MREVSCGGTARFYKVSNDKSDSGVLNLDSPPAQQACGSTTSAVAAAIQWLWQQPRRCDTSALSLSMWQRGCDGIQYRLIYGPMMISAAVWKREPQ